MSLKLISLNIEAHKHLDLVLAFLQKEQPDLVCLQEVFAVDVPLIEEALGMKGHYQAMANVTETSVHIAHALGAWGVAQFTALPVKDQSAHYYVGNQQELPIFFAGGNPNSMNRVLLVSTVEKDGQPFTVATTHFTWSTEGKYTEEQARDYHHLQHFLDHLPEFVLTGDFNSPRQGESNNVFHQLAQKYTDNIPLEVTTSIDGQFHKAGQLELMVDGLFSTPQYQVNNVRVIDGVSDHKAVMAEVER